MNKLSTEKQEMVIKGLVEGASIRSIERMTGVHRDTIMRLMVKVGKNCERIMNESMRSLKCENIQVDEIWCFVGKKQRHLTIEDNEQEVGDQWVFVALDSDSKLIPSYRVGKRSYQNTLAFLNDLSERLDNRVQLSSDSFKAYTDAVDQSFGSNVDYGQIVKSYEAEPIGAGRYSPPHVVSAERMVISGNPWVRNISTSHVERQNLTMRMQMRRFTRLTNAFSKKLENLKAAVALHFAHYNFVRVHASLRMTPAMKAGITDHIWEVGELLI
ncbi:MAG TPA: IS1 family transposase [Syntrophorhabdaceae bacterium]|nr:IS1 family transposase [Syntrophorhabdaceae bacterium]